jgi:hypothetical protein
VIKGVQEARGREAEIGARTATPRPLSLVPSLDYYAPFLREGVLSRNHYVSTADGGAPRSRCSARRGGLCGGMKRIPCPVGLAGIEHIKIFRLSHKL